jgi:hypothetical protein
VANATLARCQHRPGARRLELGSGRAGSPGEFGGRRPNANPDGGIVYRQLWRGNQLPMRDETDTDPTPSVDRAARSAGEVPGTRVLAVDWVRLDQLLRHVMGWDAPMRTPGRPDRFGERFGD